MSITACAVHNQALLSDVGEPDISARLPCFAPDAVAFQQPDIYSPESQRCKPLGLIGASITMFPCGPRGS